MKRERVFGIGLSRTGTKSLAEALTTLGYRCGHYPEGMAALEWSRTELSLDIDSVAKWDALTDIPAAAFYRELDDAFPTAKFILTLRDKATWLASISNHLSIARRDYWSAHRLEDTKVLALREKVYGSTDFDESRFSTAYDEHVRGVCDHFAGRDERLLTMDIPGGDGWASLCDFLSQETPQKRFPVNNARRKRMRQSAT
jgi:hypothetical protein